MELGIWFKWLCWLFLIFLFNSLLNSSLFFIIFSVWKYLNIILLDFLQDLFIKTQYLSLIFLILFQSLLILLVGLNSILITPKYLIVESLLVFAILKTLSISSSFLKIKIVNNKIFIDLNILFFGCFWWSLNWRLDYLWFLRTFLNLGFIFSFITKSWSSGLFRVTINSHHKLWHSTTKVFMVFNIN